MEEGWVEQKSRADWKIRTKRGSADADLVLFCSALYVLACWFLIWGLIWSAFLFSNPTALIRMSRWIDLDVSGEGKKEEAVLERVRLAFSPSINLEPLSNSRISQSRFISAATWPSIWLESESLSILLSFLFLSSLYLILTPILTLFYSNRFIDPFFGLATGILAYYIWETDAKNARPEDKRLHRLFQKRFLDSKPPSSSWLLANNVLLCIIG